MARISTLGLGVPVVSMASADRYDGKTVALAYQQATLVWQFDVWREGYAAAVVEILREGTTSYADVYTDINLSEPASNPQVLLSRTINGREFGKFTSPLYTPDAYYLRINGIEETGVNNPGIRSLHGEDGTEMDVTSAKGGIERTAGERAAYQIHVRDFGSFLEVDGSTSENTETLTAAIGVASAENGGEVILPAGTFKISTFSLPADVVLRGQGMNATILQSEEADNVVTVTGEYAGMKDLTLDGINLNPDSVGVYVVGQNHLHFERVTVKRFDTGIKVRGGDDHHYTDLFVVNCDVCAELRGDTDATSTEDGSAFTDLIWDGGSIEQSTTYGLHLKYVDAAVRDLVIKNLEIMTNVGTAAVYIEGANGVIIEDCSFSANTVRQLLTADVSTTLVSNLSVRSSRFSGSEIKLGGSCQDVTFERCIFEGSLTFNLNGPSFPIMLVDSSEGTSVTSTGDTEKLSRWTMVDAGVFKGQTSSGVSTATLYKRQLQPGDMVHMEIIATGVQRNVAAFGSLRKTAAAYCPAATLNFDGQTANFTLGTKVTGGTSAAYGILQAQTDGGVSGTLNLIRISGTFQNNEALTDTGGGAAVADGTITYVDAVILPPVQLDHYAQSAGATSWDVDVTTSGREVRAKVIGPTTGTIDWNVMVRLNKQGGIG